MVITCQGVPLRWLTDGLVPPAPESRSPGQTLRIGQTDELEGKVERTGPWWTGVVMKERIRRLEPLLRTLFLPWIYCKEEDQNVNLAICNFWSQGKTVGWTFQTLAIDNHFLWSFSERPHLICKFFLLFFYLESTPQKGLHCQNVQFFGPVFYFQLQTVLWSQPFYR